MSKPTPPAYKTLNRPAYKEALKRRGSLTIWLDPSMIWEAAPSGKRGRQPDYSDAAIKTCHAMKVLLGMALRQTTRFVESLLRLVDRDCAVLNFSRLRRHQKGLKVNIPYRGSQGRLHLLSDSAGINVEGEGEWNTRKCHDAIAARGASAIIPPRKTATPWKPDTAGAIARDESLRASEPRCPRRFC